MYKHHNNCIDCNKKLSSNPKAKRCQKCYGESKKGLVLSQEIKLKLSKLRKGKNSSLYIDGRSYIKNYCIDCHKKIDRRAIRCSSCGAKERQKNPKDCPSYIDGRSRFPYPLGFDNKLKLQIHQRDIFTCQNCEMTEEEHLIVIGTILHVHHIDYNKDNLDKNNLITLCQGCNLRANFNRTYWINFYQKKIGLKNETIR